MTVSPRHLLVPCLVLLSSAAAQEPPPQPHELRYRFDALAGSTARYTVETELRQGVRHGKLPFEEGVRWRRDWLEQRYERKGAGGRIRQMTRRIELRVESPGEAEVRWDSDSGEDPPGDLDKSGLLRLDRTVLLELTAQGQLTKVRGAVEGIDKAAYQASVLKLPLEPLAVGATWRRPSPQRVPYPPFGTLSYHTSYRLGSYTPHASPEEARWTVEATTRLVLELDAPQEGNAPREVQLTHQKAGGSLVFDGNGLLLESRFTSELEVAITSGETRRVERAHSSTLQRLRSWGPTTRKGRKGE